jgi:hypothetical protein
MYDLDGKLDEKSICMLLPCNCAAAEGDNQLYEK